MEKQQKRKITHWIHFAAGGFGGTVGAVITCPLEVIKTRLQSSMYKTDGNKSIQVMLRDIYRNEGVSGLWRGLGPNLVGVVPARAIYFSTYASSKQYLSSHMSLSKDGKETPLIHLISAIAAGLATATSTNPIWLVKTRMQLQHQPKKQDLKEMKPKDSVRVSKRAMIEKVSSAGMSTSISTSEPYYKNSFDCLVKIIKQEGVRGLFRGLSASYLGIMEGTMQWVAYEQLKTLINDSNKSESAPAAFSFKNTFLAAGVAKFIAAITTYPHEVLRTRLRQAVVVESMENGKVIKLSKPRYTGIMHVCRSVFKQEGILAFYGGLSAHILRTVPNAAIMFLCYESVVYFVDK